MKLEQVHLVVSGVVQGVGFRYSTQKAAIGLGLRGWVKNLPDGRVEAVAEGSKQEIDHFLIWCHQGPPGSKVDEVTVLKREGIKQPSFSVFEIRR